MPDEDSYNQGLLLLSQAEDDWGAKTQAVEWALTNDLYFPPLFLEEYLYILEKLQDRRSKALAKQIKTLGFSPTKPGE